jgi:hypothetical protein
MNVVWIYAAAGLIDVVFANSIEFWGGANPFAAAERNTRYAHGPDGEVVSATVLGPGTIELLILDRRGEQHLVRIVRENDSVAAYDEGGRVISRVEGVPLR